MSELKVWRNGRSDVDWIVATSAKHAHDLHADHLGSEEDASPVEAWYEETSPIAIKNDETHAGSTTRSPAEWAEHNGAGYLCSNYE